MKRYLQLTLRMDWTLFVAMLVLCVLSVLFIYSASYRGDGQQMRDLYQMQMIWFGIGLVLYLIVSLIDYRLICQWASIWYVAGIAALILVLAIGTRVNGARSWLGWGGFGIQPVEFAKLAVITALAYYLFHRPADARKRWATVLSSLALVGGPVLLILAQPDLGSAMVLMPICFGLAFVAGVRVKHLVLVAVVGLMLTPIAWTQLKDYQKARLLVFLNPNSDPLGAGWHLNQSLIAVGSGGLIGKGWLQGTQKALDYLPPTVAPNDFLFSVIAEEKGFIGSLGIVGLYAVVLFSGLRIAAHARDRLGMLLATGVVAMLSFHVFINIGMTVGLMPITGLPLPLLSYGGSFVLASMTALGLLQNIWIHRRIY